MHFRFFASIAVVAALSFFAAPAQAQFGGAGAVELGGYVPGVTMPYFSVENYANRGYHSSTFDDGDFRVTIPQIRMEGTFDSMNPTAHPTVDLVHMTVITPGAGAAVPYPASTTSNGPAFTVVRPTRNFGREVYADAAIVWDVPGIANVRSGTQYEYLICVSWPDGWGQANRNVWYNAGSTMLRVVYTIN